jgi:hypothetical protein
MRKTTVVVLAFAALLLAAGSFAAGWVLHEQNADNGRSSADLIGSCTTGLNPDNYESDDLGCSSNDAVLAYEQEHSVVCFRKEENGLGGRGVYECIEARNED